MCGVIYFWNRIVGFFTGRRSINDDFFRKKETKKIKKNSENLIKFYQLPPNTELHEITQEVLKDPLVKKAQKKSIQATKRRIFVFVYPSNGLAIKGIVSFVPDSAHNPVLVILRGGNNNFGLLNPGDELMCLGHYTTLSTLYRGGMSEGKDEFGGEDVNDVKQLIDFIPELQQKLNVQFQSKKMFLLGQSRGGMQMFLTLAKFPELQSHFTKIISLSGILDMCQCIATRPDMKEMFIDKFGLVDGLNEEEWINRRDPLLAADKIKPSLPIVIIQGGQDNRVSLEEGHRMVERLKAAGHQVEYLEIKTGNHCLRNVKDLTKIILDFLRV